MDDVALNRDLATDRFGAASGTKRDNKNWLWE